MVLVLVCTWRQGGRYAHRASHRARSFHDSPENGHVSKSEEDESERRRVACGWPKMGSGKWSHGPCGL